MQITLYVLAGWFGLGALGALTLLGMSIVLRRSELPLALQTPEAQRRQPFGDDLPGNRPLGRPGAGAPVGTARVS